MRGRFGLTCAAGAIAFGTAGTAAAEVTLHWTAPKECPSAVEVEATVTRLVGRPLRKHAAHLVFRAAVSSPDGGQWSVVLEVKQESKVTQRKISGESCAAVADAAAVAVALALNPPGAESPPTTEAPASQVQAVDSPEPLQSSPATAPVPAPASPKPDVGVVSAAAPDTTRSGRTAASAPSRRAPRPSRAKCCC